MVFLVPLALLGLFLICVTRGIPSLREALGLAFLGIALFVAVTTELLSGFNALTLPALLALWILLLLVELVVLWHSGWRQLIARLNDRLDAARQTHRQVLPMAVAIAGVLIITLGVALLAPPNTWDSMTYHMARVASWEQHQSVAFYPTSIPRQNYQMPLAEFMILHLNILGGGDGWANMVQWFALVVAVAAVSRIATALGGSPRAGWLAAAVGVTIPMAILQATSTQNDLVVSAFILLFACYLLKVRQAPTLFNLMACAAALGAALLTKGTAYVYCPAIGLVVGLFPRGGSSRERWVPYSLKLALVPVLALLLSAGHLARNYGLYQHPFSTETGSYRNERLSLPIFGANVVRSLSLHLGTPSPRTNQTTHKAVAALLGDELENPASTWAGCRFMIPYKVHEDLAGNLPHALLGVLVGVLLLCRGWRKPLRPALLYGVAVTLAAFTFAAMFKWQLWASRLHTPLFFLLAPLVPLVVPVDHKRFRLLPVALSLGLLAYALPYLLINETRPLLSVKGYSLLRSERNVQVFRSAAWLQEAFTRGAACAGQLAAEHALTDIGLCTGPDDYEYPLRGLVKAHCEGRALRFHHVAVKDPSRRLATDSADPFLILTTRPNGAAAWTTRGYTPHYTSRFLAVLLRTSPSRPSAVRTDR
ncbi:MAG: hypothetical protein HN919_09825 [Verrucomicrobia bacterium]|nr:hypothetical protein [Verrucomicrobiota bacterium]MBT7066589.1 hypothetical protein [Verrucomicrobiota bacterium]MBT7701519.1 hypothetical protein [Verrucomicrobiota bacterium]